ncbi:uncharacterized protein LOC131646871 [Vicia villosa]|uniref:uncharacterized protein LOC131646871 n=1 Tax=Vicia villosa TaxID=3911 RepID=UPI00273B27EF|nr:uncharacterized protein LOC131646871 [Vicia villosa]
MPISFSNSDRTFTGTSVALPMVIKVQINNNTVLRVSVNETSQANVLYMSAFLRMGLSETMLKPFQAYLKGNTGDGVPVKGYIDLDTTFGKGENAKIRAVRYLVIDSWSVYNVVIGMPVVAYLEAVISIVHLKMKYPIGDGMVGVVKADLEMANKCHQMCPYYMG